MSKMLYFNNKFSKFANRGELCAPSAPLASNFGDLKLRELCFFKRILTKSNFQKKISYDVIVITTPNTSTNLTSQDLSILGPSHFQLKFLATL